MVEAPQGAGVRSATGYNQYLLRSLRAASLSFSVKHDKHLKTLSTTVPPSFPRKRESTAPDAPRLQPQLIYRITCDVGDQVFC
jgi:hypothetical protein